MTVVPRFGRDFKTAKEAQASWNSGADWIVADMFNQWDGKPVSKGDLFGGNEQITLRFCELTKTCRGEK